jgi:hypothetical protein
MIWFSNEINFGHYVRARFGELAESFDYRSGWPCTCTTPLASRSHGNAFNSYHFLHSFPTTQLNVSSAAAGFSKLLFLTCLR